MNKEQLFAALESEVKDVPVPAINATLRFRVLTGKARDEFHTAIKDGDKSVSYFEAVITVSTVVDDNGAPMFDMADVETLRGKNADAVSAIAAAALTVNKIGQAAEEEAAKN